MDRSASEALWQSAPHPALRVWAGPPLRCSPNEAARQHSAYAGFDEAAWQALGTRALAAGKGTQVLSAQVIALDGGVLAWLLPGDAFDASGLVSRQTLELAQEHGCVGLFARNLQTGQGWWDRHCFRIFGLDPAQGVPQATAASRLIHPEDRASFGERYAHALREGGRFSTRWRAVRPDGEIRYLNSSYEVRLGPQGQPLSMVGALFDDSDAVQRTRAELRVLERLSRVGELAGVSIWHIDWPSQTVRFNSVGRRFMGLPVSQSTIALADVRATVHSEDMRAVEQAALRALAGEEIVDLTARYRHADGTWRTLLTRHGTSPSATSAASPPAWPASRST